MHELSTLTREERMLCARLGNYASTTQDVRLHGRMREAGAIPSAVVGTFLRSNKIFKAMPPLVCSERIQYVMQALSDNGILVRLSTAEVLAALGTGYPASATFYWIRNLERLQDGEPVQPAPMVLQFAPEGTPAVSTKRVEIKGQAFDVDMDTHGRSIAGTLRIVLPVSA